MDQVLRTEDGREIALGTEAELRAAYADLVAATGGSSGQGRFSYLFGLGADEVLSGEAAARLGEEAAEFQLIFSDRLSESTNALLGRLAGLRDRA